MREKPSCKAWVLVAVLMAILASASRAEDAVGLEAQGVDPWAAFLNRQDLDVRDELGRPVRREVIERQLRGAGLEAARASSIFSGLPKLKAVLSLLAAAVPLRAWFGAVRAGAAGRGVFAVEPGRRTEKSATLPLVSIALILTAGAAASRPQARSRSTLAAAPLPLRC